MSFRLYATVFALLLVAGLSACSSSPIVPYSPAPETSAGHSARLAVREPGEREVVVVINSNIKMVHAGMFAGKTLFDPGGSYDIERSAEEGWRGPSLADYVRFQLEDGPDVKLYRFELSPERFGAITERVREAVFTVPLFCAVQVEGVLAGIPPFETLQDSWFKHPASLAVDLDRVIIAGANGTCVWPDGSSCYRQHRAAVAETMQR